MIDLHDFLYGGSAVAALACGLYFLRFWRDTGDRLFVMFAVALWALSLNYALLGVYNITDETRPYVYLIRLASFLLIIVAVVDKNRPQTRKSLPHVQAQP